MLAKISLIVIFFVMCEAEYIPYYGAATSFNKINNGYYGLPKYEQGGNYEDYDYGYRPASYGKQYDEYGYPKYKFSYGVNDPHTGDHKSQHEERDGDVVKGYYTVADPDGTLRTVHYTADDHNGFNAVVQRDGIPIHPEPVGKVFLQPVDKVVLEPVYEKVVYDKPIYEKPYGYDYNNAYAGYGPQHY
ncbi:unnamed protein product [Phyllotreta striolata]|uniref:Uncharacterized protein n=1 Tax=Phyllotreta striolata TaxID=444603 RepID=A0A9N9TN33_PHYSR|nr:unnamed protein product [Phyllotreta striolata]